MMAESGSANSLLVRLRRIYIDTTNLCAIYNYRLFVDVFEDMTNGDANIAFTILASMRLRRLTPTTV